jgi:palmitoyltransferase
MNHHCVFTNNCVGLENQRYFLLFILYTLIGSLYYLASIISIWNHYIYRENQKLMTFLFCLDLLLAGSLFIYNLWSWFLACIGHTTIEFVGRNTGYKTNNYDFTFTRVRDNLFKVFGTKSYFQLLSPSLRYNAFNGIEWSF